MTVIPVNDDYRIELDSHSWQISKRKGTVGWRGVAWFPRLTQCVGWLTEQGLREADLDGAGAVVNALCTLLQSLGEAIDRASMEDIARQEIKRIGHERPGAYHSAPEDPKTKRGLSI